MSLRQYGEAVLRGADLCEWMETGKLRGRAEAQLTLRLDPAAPRRIANSLSSEKGAAGGFLTKTDVRDSLEYALAQFASVRQLATVLREQDDAAQQLTLPTIDLSGKEGFLVLPGAAVSDEPGIAFKARQLFLPKFTSGKALMPFELLRDSALLAGEIGSVLGQLLARAQNPYFVSGTGVGQPTGVLTEAPVAVTAASPTAFTLDEVWSLVASVPQPYRDSPGAAFMCSDGTYEYLHTLKDAQGRYLWKSSGLDRWPVVTNIDWPEIAAGTKPLAFGDWSRFVIRDVGGVRLAHLVEQERETDRDVLMAFLFSDSCLLDAGTGPIQALKMAAS